jgi:alanine-glyoxylate transaminase/serine-glyoxylate transaminase/serine-pyruvate transaminase
LPDRLLIPGPVAVAEETLREMGGPVQVHYGPEWTAAYNETRELLQRVFHTLGEVHILVGSGSAGLDAAIGSLTSPGETVLVGVNGFFGERLVEICQGYALQAVPVAAPLGEPLTVEAFRSALEQYPKAAALAVVHLETSTAVVNPVQEIAAVAAERGVPVIVDAVSSLGGVPLEMDAWGIDICASASQKCLGTPPGVAPVAVSERARTLMRAKPERGHGWYLNLQNWSRYAEEWADWHPFPITMATNTVLALRIALQRLLADGIEARVRHYTALAMRLREGVRRLGLQPFTPDDRLAPVLTAIHSPDGIPSGEIVRYLYKTRDIRIAGGLGEGIRDRLFRVGHMGPMVGEADIDAVLDGLEAFLAER